MLHLYPYFLQLETAFDTRATNQAALTGSELCRRGMHLCRYTHENGHSSSYQLAVVSAADFLFVSSLSSFEISLRF